MVHKAEIVAGSMKRNAVTGGVEFKMHCCGELESSVHLQNMAAFENHDQRVQVIEQYLAEHSERHAAELATEDFLKNYGVADVTECEGCK